MPSEAARVEEHQLSREVISLIRAKVWDGLDRDRFLAWLRQFDSGEERLLGALIARNLVYRSTDQCIAVMRQALERGLVELARKTAGSSRPRWNRIVAGQDASIDVFFAPVSWNGQPPGKSGHQIVRLFRRHFAAPSSRLINPWEFEARFGADPRSRLVFLDDILGTGTQFEDCMRINSLASAARAGKVAYFPMIAHPKGIEHLQDLHPEVFVSPAELLGTDSGLKGQCERWSSDSRFRFGEHPILVYRNLVAKREPFTWSRFDAANGFGELDLLVGFEDATPDNSLPILWDGAENWFPLLRR